jgi:tryptophan halogenase
MLTVKDVVVLGAGSAGLISAILLKKYMNTGINVKIVQSGKVPILGVGEGTTEHIDFFVKVAGIDREEFIRETKATYKGGVLFEDWNYEGHRYVHSLREYHVIGYPDKNGKRDYAVPFFNGGIPLGGCATVLRPDLDTREEELCGNTSATTLQFHFNNFALNDYLRKKCAEFGIEIIEDHILDVEFDDDNYITAICGDQRHEADFFIDCTGFSKFLINHYNPEFQDYSDQLIVDSALFFPYETPDPLIPFTRAKAMKYGWFWSAPTQDRSGNGYVYSSKYCTPEMALDEVRAMGYNLPDETVNNVKHFKSGHLKESWSKNCLAVGVASAFFEPMEAAALSTGVLQVMTLIDYLHAWSKENPDVSGLFNRQFHKLYHNAFEFIRMHYITERDDTEFWKFYQNLTIPKELEEKLVLIQNRPASTFEFDIPSPFILYGASNFQQVMGGLGLIDGASYEQYLKNFGVWEETLQQMSQIETNVLVYKRQFVNHREKLGL